ncbi:hypothetical protein GVAV_001520 [Gurleya vavrai]
MTYIEHLTKNKNLTGYDAKKKNVDCLMNMQDPNCFNDNFNIISESLIRKTINILEEFVKEIQKERLNGSNKLKSDTQRSVNTELKIFNLNFVFDNSSTIFT